MTRIYVCHECGQYNGHFAGCPEDVLPDEEGDETECEQEVEPIIYED